MILEPLVQISLNVSGSLLNFFDLEESLKAQVSAETKLLLGLSGGVDSVALLEILLTLQKQIGFSLEVAHIDHGLRTKSQADAAFVQDLASAHGLAFHLLRAEAPEAGVNTEAWGRTLRYKFFDQIRAEKGIDWVLTAHTRDDQLETVLMQMLSNKTPRGIQAVDYRRHLLRPLLGVDKQSLLNLAQQRGLKFVEDESNQNESYLRNKIRHSLLSEICRLFGDVALENLKNQAQSIVDDLSILDRQAAAEVESLKFWNFGSRHWLSHLGNCLRVSPVEIRWRILEHVFLPQLGFKLGREAALSLSAVVLKQQAGVDLPGGYRVSLAQGGLELVKL